VGGLPDGEKTRMVGRATDGEKTLSVCVTV